MEKNPKVLTFIVFLVFFTLNASKAFTQDYTFCYGSVSLTLYDGGSATQLLFGSDGSVVKSLNGEWTAYGNRNDMPGQLVKIKFSVSAITYSYTLIRDGFGTPSVLIDNTGRRYTLCNKAKDVKTTKPLEQILSEIDQRNKEDELQNHRKENAESQWTKDLTILLNQIYSKSKIKTERENIPLS